LVVPDIRPISHHESHSRDRENGFDFAPEKRLEGSA
jgi:hypothetical protein